MDSSPSAHQFFLPVEVRFFRFQVVEGGGTTGDFRVFDFCLSPLQKKYVGIQYVLISKRVFSSFKSGLLTKHKERRERGK